MGVLAALTLGPPPRSASPSLSATYNVGAANTPTESNFLFGDRQNTPRGESFHTCGHSGSRWRRLNLCSESHERTQERKSENNGSTGNCRLMLKVNPLFGSFCLLSLFLREPNKHSKSPAWVGNAVWTLPTRPARLSSHWLARKGAAPTLPRPA